MKNFKLSNTKMSMGGGQNHAVINFMTYKAIVKFLHQNQVGCLEFQISMGLITKILAKSKRK
jgi:hypothetical protein